MYFATRAASSITYFNTHVSVSHFTVSVHCSISVNKVGFCVLQEVGMSSNSLVTFISLCADFMEIIMDVSDSLLLCGKKN